MRKFFTLSILGAACLAWTMNAAPRSAEDALRVAISFYQEQSLLRSVSDADFHLVYTGESDGLRSTSEPYYYIYNIGEDGGFVMVSGDDRVDAVIGYGLSGAFDPNKIPANMAGWFKEYERQIDFARTLPERVFPETSTKAAASDSLPNRVEPLITTQWDQLTPYNLLCPMVGYQRTPTGCGATAMAQILNYHKWPERATGTGSYTVPELGGDTTYVDLSQFTFDWANMADVYDENATTEQREAVAELMFAAGAAINMVYSTTWSYSQYNQIPEGFVTHMGYDENLAYLMRNCYDSDSWESTIKKELAEKRPVFYMAQSIRDGHYFVCDGYVSSPGQGDYFHINWGWGGMRNNYFRLDLLNEYDVEGNMTGYSWDQVALVGIQKPTDSSERIEKVAMVRFEPEEDYIAQGNTLHLSYDYQYSGSIPTRRLQHGFAIYTDNGQEVGSLENELEIIPQYNYWYRERWRITDLRLDPGTYKVRMLYRFDGDEGWKEMTPLKDALLFDFTLTATEDRIFWDSTNRILTGDPVQMERSDLPAYTWFATSTLRNSAPDETQASLLMHIFSSTIDAMFYAAGVYLDAGAAETVEIPLTIQLEPGEYTVELVASNITDTYTYPIEGTRTTFTVSKEPTANEEISSPTGGVSVRVEGDRLRVESAAEVREVRLFDITGRQAAVGQGPEVSLAGVAKGIYVVRVVTDEETLTRKVLIGQR